MFSLALYSLFHYALECLVNLTSLEYLFQRESDKNTYSYTVFFNNFILEILDMSSPSKIIDEFLFFFTVLDDSSSLILNKFLLNNNIDS